MIEENEHCKYSDFPSDFDNKFSGAIRSANKKQINQSITAAFDYISKMKINDILYAIHRLILLTVRVVNEINRHKLYSTAPDIQELDTEIGNCETLEEIKKVFTKMVIEVLKNHTEKANGQNTALVNTVCGMIEDNYKDPNLSLQWIADVLKYSASYVGRIFKADKKLSVSEYINSFRLNQAIELLADGTYSINHVFESVGFVSESYFYTIFKKKYGCTPKEYRSARMKSSPSIPIQ